LRSDKANNKGRRGREQGKVRSKEGGRKTFSAFNLSKSLTWSWSLRWPRENESIERRGRSRRRSLVSHLRFDSLTDWISRRYCLRLSSSSLLSESHCRAPYDQTVSRGHSRCSVSHSPVLLQLQVSDSIREFVEFVHHDL
jgi:hypothetical protein